jgi:SAM-dependent methyltransferase
MVMALRQINDPFGAAVKDYYKSKLRFTSIKVYSNISGQQKIKPSYLFRKYEKMPRIEQIALDFCTGKVLDIGAGAGSHSLYLQEKGFEVSSLDISPGCCEVMQKRGISTIICENIYEHSGIQYNTLLMLMNGIGVSGDLYGLRKLLNHCKSLLLPGGQILFDSSDIESLFYEDDGSKWINLNTEYYGEVNYKVTYKKIKGKSFGWLFIDADTLNKIAEEEGFVFCKLAEGEQNDYLGKLSIK